MIGQRAMVLHRLKTSQPPLSVITSKEACQIDSLISNIEEKVLFIKKGMEMEREKLRQWLTANGYKEVSVVVEKGEYSQRQWVFDVYPVTEENPVRVEFFGDVIDLIRVFDIETQRSIREIEETTMFPAQEFGVNNSGLRVENIGIEYNLIIELSGIHNMEVIAAGDHGFTSEFQTLSSKITVVSHMPFIGEGIDSAELSIKGLGILPEERRSISDIPAALLKIRKNIITVLSSEAQAMRLKEILFDGGIIAPVIDKRDVNTYDGKLCITIGRLSSGIDLPDLLMLTDREIFGERPLYRSLKKSKVSRLLLNIDDLKSGDFVVHKDHGIGKFTGIERQRADEYEEDLMTIEYANGKLYVPFQGIGRLQKYSAAEGHVPSVDRLGSKKWQQTKQRVKKGIKELAEKLLKLYAERKMARGFVFSNDTIMHREFDDFFPYEETPDQVKAIEEIKEHMRFEVPMDMLLCGDVGYGKTEVAVRAVFRAIYDGKQVAVLVPTTLLAEQHFRTFKTRFSGFPVKIDYLSRFKTKDEIKKTMAAAAHGEVDIIIGTHMLLNKDVKFYDLGLMIIDEEHRFGVAQKEKLMELKKGVDVLTLTATPIPRTLQMSLSGIREMCTIETPPEERLAVRSIVTEFNADTIKEAIERELAKDGQVFFVHNRIGDIERVADYIKGLIPDARIAVAHGQMKETDLEKKMLDFLNRETDVLVCTAIIGSGLDITTANTIIVDRADTFGLSDLYQLRGRVGRGNVQAYAYFLIPGEDIITDDAKKRLKAIKEMSYLGAGFRLALKDLEIRGAGNLLGSEQSGHIYKVGFETYMEMLEKAVSELKGEEVKEEIEPQMRLRLSAFIPEQYISDITLRLSIYKRISAVKSIDALSDIKDEIQDRFGTLPEEANNLIRVMRIKILAKKLLIALVSEVDSRYRFFFLTDPENRYSIPEDFFDKLLNALFSIQKAYKGVRFLPDGFEVNCSGLPSPEKTEDTLTLIETILQRLWTTISK
ncbi:MAG: transcription-repair coupling factor [Thermodesulfovibrionales bacterium]|nr:transcription-repair coupling factor [Thermodesulfovibrionales bacterium]